MGQSARLVCGYIYANAGEGESTQDLVFGGQNILAENGTCLMESRRFSNECICADMDLERITAERRRMTTFPAADPYQEKGGYVTVPFELERGAKEAEGSILRYVDAAPFVPADPVQRERRCEEILSIQAMGLKKRLEHTGCKMRSSAFPAVWIPRWLFW